MNRLTKRNEKGVAYVAIIDKLPKKYQEIECYSKELLEAIFAIFQKLAFYEDKEEQGLLIKLPCKVGSIVIVLECNVDIPYVKEEIVIAFELWNKNRIISLFIRTISGLYEANKTVFLTREEAEKALKEMEE